GRWEGGLGRGPIKPRAAGPGGSLPGGAVATSFKKRLAPERPLSPARPARRPAMTTRQPDAPSQPAAPTQPAAFAGVSALVPNWNGGDRLAACVASLLRELEAAARSDPQAAKPWEVVVADDDSPGGPADLALLARTFPGALRSGALRLFRRSPNGGFSATVNDAARVARGAFLLACNNDLLAQRGFVEELLRP